MNEEQNNEVQAPNWEGEEIKLPENADIQPEVVEKQSIVNGPLLMGLAFALIAILAGLYYWFNILNTVPEIPVTPTVTRPTAEENNEPESTTAEAQTESAQVVSTSDEVTAIEADLEATNLDEIDAELNAIEAELDAALQ